MAHAPDTGPAVHVNQVGYLPNGPKRATIATEAQEPLLWELLTDSGDVAASGDSTPRGFDRAAGHRVHTIDFTDMQRPGHGYRLYVDGQHSYPFDAADTVYAELHRDALHFFYLQRSGIPIDNPLLPDYARPAGHIGIPPNQGDTNVPCQPGVGDYALDVRGGWYDAGDHGKYVVNGGIAVAQLLSQYERTRTATVVTSAALDDCSLTIPENGNDIPGILDEVRWELEFLLRMQIPPGKPNAGMAHHKVHDEAWTAMPCLPHQDPQPRHLHPPSTAATLNVAAVAAHAARLFRPFDPRFAARCLGAARTAWAAAQQHPAMYADPADKIGGHPYDDNDVLDERYWAAAELFISTGEHAFLDALRNSPYWTGDAFGATGFDWRFVAALGRLDLATVPSHLPDRDRDDARVSIQAAADRYLTTIHEQPYGVPLSVAEYGFGSNSILLNKLVVIATAFDITGEPHYRDGVLEAMDYLLGRNPLNQSYVTGYGTRHAHHQHSRTFAHQLDPALPPPPVGALAGGPNTGLQNPIVHDTPLGPDSERPAPQRCYLDDIRSWSTNGIAINWNSALSWVASFAADQAPKPESRPAPTAPAHPRHALPRDVTVAVTASRELTVDLPHGWSVLVRTHPD
ncbi:glycoside hydrolase family 9 protein [Dactylosporangium sp. NBC_01737]|uniref:glycoside hydrolase family 9 protein n=1 Tax=Dactylosporangium sp. NBC_01737 TaxID=2975959 RepID=UPI002E12624B|nr:glycoside hydrolase family 9 protein [Dactylosporangium sp. NBC_01737]